MKYSSRNMPADNPLANLLVIIVGALVIGASIVLGFFAFIVVISVVLVLAAVIRIRLWWLSRFGARKPASDRRAQTGQTGDNGVIEGEYRVVADDRDGE
ncbi:MAG: hypothetical protein AAFN50_08425 [Pseudomonadota bacterium]